jgi:NTP pyrophosphatase (non-canonical NTP hydrolase)
MIKTNYHDEHNAAEGRAIIRGTVPPAELWAQLAEEATELAHAALKLRRATATSRTNPTPVTPTEAYAAVMEELADVTLLAEILLLDFNSFEVETIRRRKLLRWRDRLQEKEEQHD